ncbi:FAD/NAD(P)-binding protein [Aequorivita echinoideorum]|uniref:FAD/NAD(P)-binding protein n=1 Tax=Aequorivita echinoideorum TaxID=1549647 RepID=A0ABS5S5L5_9FLAO|nr:FAD/NAD(P)-binding protein [Aequorivita echinoideorum]MBT0608513.1 FAD/NAD(P)-binding protein [Aequorivita echinoideorum]
MKKIGIVGGGFSGTMLAVHLIEKSNCAVEIFIFDNSESPNRGIAYQPYSNAHLLNVSAQKMSAFPSKPDHFVNWVMLRRDFSEKNRQTVAHSFLPRKIYGDYLQSIWNNAIKIAAEKQIIIKNVDETVTELSVANNHISLKTNGKTVANIDCCILATGNNEPRNPQIGNMDFYQSNNYFRNPWKLSSVKGLNSNLPVLIIGNGLTMVDTVFGLREQNFNGQIYSISPNGFGILPHTELENYTRIIEELPQKISLHNLFSFVNKHLKIARKNGYPPESVIDALRPHLQKFWQSFSEYEKQLFMRRFRHLWGSIRHRIPMDSHKKIQELCDDGILHIISGTLLNMNEFPEHICVRYFDKKKSTEQEIIVSRVINCTGPETDLLRLEGNFLTQCLNKDLLKQDALKLGISTNTENFKIIDRENKPQDRLYTLGPNLKGELWESTAVNEIRTQAEKLSEIILREIASQP